MGLGGLLNSNTPPIAVDFGVSSMKVLQIAPGETRSLLAASCVETPQELLDDAMGRLEFQLAALPGVIKKGKYRGRRLMISIPAGQVWLQHLQVQRADGANMAQLVASQLQTQTGYDPATLVIRHHEVCDSQRGSASRTETICVAARRGLILKMLDSLRRHKLEVIGVHSEHLALGRALSVMAGPTEEEQATVALDLGYGSSKVVIMHGEKPVFAKTIEISGSSMDALASEQLGCGVTAARTRRLRSERLVLAEPAGVGASAGISAREAATAAVGVRTRTSGTDLDLGEPIEAISDEISMCLRYHKGLFPDMTVGKAVFVGGEARHEGLCRELARRVRLSAHVAEPLAALEGLGEKGRAVNIEFSEPQPGWAVPLGLCLSPADI